MHPDDERLGELVRLIRRETALKQAQLALAARVPLNDLKRIESGDAGSVKLARLRRVMEAAGGRARLVPWWRGAAADHLLDKRHAALVERVVGILRTRGWDVHVEVSYSEFGERGSIDVLALRRDRCIAVVLEIKTAIGSLEETNRVLDAKWRLAPAIVSKRFGWRPRIVACVLVLPEASTVRRVVDRHAATLAATYPARGGEVRAWLRKPDSALRGIWFLSEVRHASTISG